MFGCECGRLVRNKVLLVLFAVSCVVTLCFVHLFSSHAQTEYMQSVFRLTGRTYSQTYTDRLQACKPPQENSLQADIHANMLANNDSLRCFYEDYDPTAIAGFLYTMQDRNGEPISPLALHLMEGKYRYLSTCVTQLRTDSSATDVYFDYLTPKIHTDVFVSFGTVLLLLTSFFAVCCVFTVLSEDSVCNTEGLVRATAYGRRMLLYRVGAAVCVATLAFAALFLLGYGCMFTVHDFSGMWQQSVSSLNNMAVTHEAQGPFVSWGSMTLGAYFAASVGVSWLVMLTFLLTAAAIGGLRLPFFAAAGVFFGLQAVITVLLVTFVPTPSSFLFYILRMTGAGLIYHRGVWFSEGGFLTLFPYTETVAAVVGVFLCGGLFLLSYRRYRRADA